MEPFSTRKYSHSELATGEHLVRPVIVSSLESAARGLHRTRIIHLEDGRRISEEGLQVLKLMEENSQRHAREKASPDGLEMPIVND